MENQLLVAGLSSRLCVYQTKGTEDEETCNIYAPGVAFARSISEIKLGHKSTICTRFAPFGPAFITHTPLLAPSRPEGSSIKLYAIGQPVDLLSSVDLPHPVGHGGIHFFKMPSVEQQYRILVPNQKSLDFLPLSRAAMKTISKRAKFLGSLTAAKAQISEEIKAVEMVFKVSVLFKNFEHGLYRLNLLNHEGQSVLPVTFFFPTEYPSEPLKMRDLPQLPLLLQQVASVSEQAQPCTLQDKLIEAVQEEAEICAQKKRPALESCLRRMLEILFPEGIPKPINQQSILRRANKAMGPTSLKAIWPRSLVFSMNFRGHMIAASRLVRFPHPLPQPFINSIAQLDRPSHALITLQRAERVDSSDPAFDDQLATEGEPSLADTFSEGKEPLSERLLELRRQRGGAQEEGRFEDSDSQQSEGETPVVMSSSDLNKTMSSMSARAQLRIKIRSSLSIISAEPLLRSASKKILSYLNFSHQRTFLENCQALVDEWPECQTWQQCLARAQFLAKHPQNQGLLLKTSTFFKNMLKLHRPLKFFYLRAQLSILLALGDIEAPTPQKILQPRTESQIIEEHIQTEESRPRKGLASPQLGRTVGKRLQTQGRARTPTMSEREAEFHLSDQEFVDIYSKSHAEYKFKANSDPDPPQALGGVLLVKNRLTPSDNAIIWEIISNLLITREILERAGKFIETRMIEKTLLKFIELVFRKGPESLEYWLRGILRELI